MLGNYYYSIRLCKSLCVASVALLGLLVAFGNTTDYGSNFAFVQHVLSMDTTFPGNKSMYRAIDSNVLHHIAYIFIILMEYIAGILCLIGFIAMIRNLKGGGRDFNHSKLFAVYGLNVAIAIWFFGFQVIGGEWFGMWMSKTWNGLSSSFRLVTFVLLSLVFIVTKDEDLDKAD